MIQSSFKYKYCDPRQYFIAQVIKSDSKAIFNMTKGTFYFFYFFFKKGKISLKKGKQLIIYYIDSNKKCFLSPKSVY